LASESSGHCGSVVATPVRRCKCRGTAGRVHVTVCHTHVVNQCQLACAVTQPLSNFVHQQKHKQIHETTNTDLEQHGLHDPAVTRINSFISNKTKTDKRPMSNIKQPLQDARRSQTGFAALRIYTGTVNLLHAQLTTEKDRLQ